LNQDPANNLITHHDSASSYISCNPDIQPPPITLTEFLTCWKESDIADLTNKVELFNEEPTTGGFSEVFRGLYDINGHANKVSFSSILAVYYIKPLNSMML
jgi:hypothetical protein